MEEKKKTKPNWSNDECLSLAYYMAQYQDILRGKLGPGLTSEKKRTTWKLVTDRMNASFTAVKRSQGEVEKKRHNIFTQTKSEIPAHKKAQCATDEGPSLKSLNAIAEVVMSIHECLTTDMPCFPPAPLPVTSLDTLSSTSHAQAQSSK